MHPLQGHSERPGGSLDSDAESNPMESESESESEPRARERDAWRSDSGSEDERAEFGWTGSDIPVSCTAQECASQTASSGSRFRTRSKLLRRAPPLNRFAAEV